MTELISNFKVADRKSFVEFIELLRSNLRRYAAMIKSDGVSVPY